MSRKVLVTLTSYFVILSAFDTQRQGLQPWIASRDCGSPVLSSLDHEDACFRSPSTITCVDTKAASCLLAFKVFLYSMLADLYRSRILNLQAPVGTCKTQPGLISPLTMTGTTATIVSLRTIRYHVQSDPPGTSRELVCFRIVAGWPAYLKKHGSRPSKPQAWKTWLEVGVRCYKQGSRLLVRTAARNPRLMMLGGGLT